MPKGRVLFVNQEIMPYSPESEISAFGRHLPAFTQEQGREIRVFMPRLSSIKERQHQLHEVIRLSGMNLIVNNCDHQLIIKVGSIPTARMQVYFIDNEEYFMKAGGLLTDDGRLEKDADERILFFGRGTLEAVRKLAWQPNIIHYTGWFSCMVPFYVRRINKENAFFSEAKTVFTLTNDRFEGGFGQQIEKKLKNDGATAKDLKMMENLDHTTLTKAAICYASGIVIGSPDVDPELVAFARENKRNIVEYNEDRSEFFKEINALYTSLAGSVMK